MLTKPSRMYKTNRGLGRFLAGYSGASAAAFHRFSFLSQYLDKLIYSWLKYVKPFHTKNCRYCRLPFTGVLTGENNADGSSLPLPPDKHFKCKCSHAGIIGGGIPPIPLLGNHFNVQIEL
jgi:hypothetical protein